MTPPQWKHVRIVKEGKTYAVRMFMSHLGIGDMAKGLLKLPDVKTEKVSGLGKAVVAGQKFEEAFEKLKLEQGKRKTSRRD